MKKTPFLLAGALVFGISAVFADTLLSPIFLTIVEPNSQNPVLLNPRGDVLYPARANFDIRAVAQPQTEGSLFGWAVIPGTDGSTDSERAITNFEAEKTASGVKLTWTPRSLFDVTKVFEKDPGNYAFDAENGARYEQVYETCEYLKIPPSPGDDSIPGTVDCFFPKKPSVSATSAEDDAPNFKLFDQIVDPFDFSDRILLPPDSTVSPGGESSIDKNLENSTVFRDEFCHPPAGSGFSVGWIYRDGPYPQTTPEGFFEVDPYWKPDANAVYSGGVTCSASTFFEDSLYCKVPFYDSFDHEFVSGEKDLFCDGFEGTSSFDCLHQCSKNFYADDDCKNLENCSLACTGKYLSQAVLTSGGIRIVKSISPKIIAQGERIPQFLQIENNGTGTVSGSVSDDFSNPVSASIAQLSDTPFEFHVTGTAASRLYCSRNGVQRLECDFTLEAGEPAEVKFYLEGRSTGAVFGAGKRKTEYDGKTITTDFEVVDPTEGRMTTRIFSNRSARIFSFGETATITAEFINKTGEPNNNITLDFSFDPKCLDLPAKPSVEGFDCGDPLGGKMRCSTNVLDGETTSLPLDFLVKNVACENTPITLSARSPRFSRVTTDEKITTQEKASGIRAILKESPPGEDWKNADYWYFDPHFGDTTKTPELSLSPLPGAWENHMIQPGSFRPNVKNEGYFGSYLFQYANYLECFAGDGGWAYGFMPIKEKFVLVDGFDQYEIYGVPPEDYAAQEGVTRENGELLAILTDPSATEVEIPLSDGNGWHFAVFEVRESSNLNLPKKITDPIVAKEVSGFPAVAGHLISSATEVGFDTSGAALSIPSPQKMQWEFFEENGGYSLPVLRADKDGEIRISGVQKDRLNRYSGAHLLSGVYYSSDTKFSEGLTTTAIDTGRSAAGFFPGHFSAKPLSYFFSKENLFGTVFDQWTTQVVPTAEVRLSGERKFVAGGSTSVFSIAESDADGFYSFLFEPGKYKLQVRLVGGRTDTFSLPTACSDTPPYEKAFCEGSLDFVISENSETLQNLPILPNLRGKISNSGGRSFRIFLTDTSGNYISDTLSTPEGKFSFFVPAGTYHISHILDVLEKKVNFSGGDVVSSPISVGSEFSLSLSL